MFPIHLQHHIRQMYLNMELLVENIWAFILLICVGLVAEGRCAALMLCTFRGCPAVQRPQSVQFIIVFVEEPPLLYASVWCQASCGASRSSRTLTWPRTCSRTPSTVQRRPLRSTTSRRTASTWGRCEFHFSGASHKCGLIWFGILLNSETPTPRYVSLI